MHELRNKKEINVFANIFFSPTPMQFLNDMLAKIILNDNELKQKIIHISGGKRLSRFEFVKLISNFIKEPHALVSPENIDFNKSTFQKDLSLIPSDFVKLNKKHSFEDSIKTIGAHSKELVNFGKWEELNIVSSNEGTIRGNHYHKETVELFIILEGEIKVVTQKVINQRLDKNASENIVKKGDIFLIDPMINHTFYINKKSRWMNLLSKRMNPHNPDINKV